ncbi:hypothetical protein EEB18_010830 [Sphingopyxis sp. OPL5]|uniref:hypothetical protein n=1 Tax=unclassified Sphingopyxis TaxID=2614943 RepID=UPI0006F3675A|nr:MULTISPECIES: hypothetical protein [unclassified Sphingopyxis]KQZ65723.1 hypothetical protein ASD67_01060 [Sphingopyxis sp. Root1497]OHD04679.1 MAG: hypothetical protein A2885_15770 [Sphingopyxis sp. RIFCSPHIGHO2_01_FULL_65_24]QNO29376.1 hypothetical protein EEB18_010830 [Sphingopyxis sp. OPL5]
MADEIHTTRDPDGTTHTTTIVDREPRRGGGMGMMLILLVALAVAGFVAFQFLGNEKAETGAITEAAQKVGDAAQDVGDAAQKAVD